MRFNNKKPQIKFILKEILSSLKNQNINYKQIGIVGGWAKSVRKIGFIETSISLDILQEYITNVDKLNGDIDFVIFCNDHNAKNKMNTVNKILNEHLPQDIKDEKIDLVVSDSKTLRQPGIMLINDELQHIIE